MPSNGTNPPSPADGDSQPDRDPGTPPKQGGSPPPRPPKRPGQKGPGGVKKPGGPKKPGDGDEDQPTPRGGAGFLWVILIVVALVMVFIYRDNPSNEGVGVRYDFFLEQVEEGNVTEVTFHGQVLTGKWKEIPEKPEDSPKLDEAFNTTMPSIDDNSLLPLLKENGVEIRSKVVGGGLGASLMFLAGPLLLIAFFYWMMRRSSDPMSGGMLGNFVRSPAKRFKAEEERTTFKDVAGMKQAKRELMEIVEFLKNPEKFHRLGAQIPKGVLLMGPPGNGKTLLARATAGEADVPFFSISGSEFIQMFVGVGASRVRDLFQNAKDSAPAIMFIDEIDAVGRVRGAGVGGGHDEREQTLNQILSEMDGFNPTESVIVMAATNRPDVLDPALLRPGRFDRHITVEKPAKEGRLGILKVHTKKVPLADDVDLDDIAGNTIGFSGAELKNLVNEAALIASREDSEFVTRDHFAQAADRVTMGPEREEIVDEAEKEMTAYHEAGHALVGWVLPKNFPLTKVSIVPRGRAAGVTIFQPDEEQPHISQSRLEEYLAMILAGRAADILVFGECTAGAESDIHRATELARQMVAHWGMSETVGPVAFRQAEEHPFLGKEIQHARVFSEETARVIDEEVQKILRGAHDHATQILIDHRDKLDHLTEELLNREVLSRDEVEEILGERPAYERHRPTRNIPEASTNGDGQHDANGDGEPSHVDVESTGGDESHSSD